MRVWLHILSAASLILYSGISQAQSYNGDDFKEDVREALPYAELALLAYGAEGVNNGTKTKLSRYDSLENGLDDEGWDKLNPLGYEENVEISFSSTLFYNIDKNELVVAFRGTVDDLGKKQNREKILLGRVHPQEDFISDFLPRVQGSIDRGDIEVRNKEGLNVTFTGHSLGGQLAALAGVLWNQSKEEGGEKSTYQNSGATKVYTFNPAAIGRAMKKSLRGDGYDLDGETDITNVRLGGDYAKFDPGKEIGKIIDIGTKPQINELLEAHEIDEDGGSKAIHNYIFDVLALIDNGNIDISSLDFKIRHQPSPSESSIADNRRRDSERNHEPDDSTHEDVPVDLREISNVVTARTQGSGSIIGSPSQYFDIFSKQTQEQEQEISYTFDENNTNYNERQNYNTDGIVVEEPIDIILGWGDRPRDLDSHLTGPQADGSGRFHINFDQRGSLDNSPNAFLHRDDLSHAPGGENLPEQTRITELREGVYRFYVNDFSNIDQTGTRALSSSGATVSIHHSGQSSNTEGRGIGAEGLANIRVPEGRTGNTWHAFDLDSRTSTFTPRDEFIDVSREQDVPFNE